MNQVKWRYRYLNEGTKKKVHKKTKNILYHTYTFPNSQNPIGLSLKPLNPLLLPVIQILRGKPLYNSPSQRISPGSHVSQHARQGRKATYIILLIQIHLSFIPPEPHGLLLTDALDLAVVALVPQRRGRSQEKAAGKDCADEG